MVWPTDRNILDGKDVDVYSTDAFFPSTILGKVKFGSKRQYKLVEVTIWPYRYNPVTSALKKLVSGTVIVRGVDAVSPSAKAAIHFGKANSRQKKVLDEVTGMVVNASAASTYPTTEPFITGGTAQAQSLAEASATGSHRYVILTTSAISTNSKQLAGFVALKEAQGFMVRVITESAWGGGLGDAAANNIRAYLQAHYLTDNIAYVLFIGDPRSNPSAVPMKMCWPRRNERFGDIDALHLVLAEHMRAHYFITCDDEILKISAYSHLSVSVVDPSTFVKELNI
jgi:hypothetical protein